MWENVGLFAVVNVCITAGMCQLLIVTQRWHGRYSHDKDLGGVQKFHHVAVPRIGGLAIIAALALTTGLAGSLLTRVSDNLQHWTWIMLLASLPAFAFGMLEDVTKRVPVRVRLTATFASALLGSWLLGATVHHLNIWGVDQLLQFGPIALVVTAVVVAGGANAVNIIDGFNGLAATTVLIMAGGYGLIAFHAHDVVLVAFALLLASAALGFLLLNFPTGRLFLGDGGAYFLGFGVAELAVLLLVRHPEINAWWVLSVCSYPVIEVLFSIYRRKVVRKSTPGAPDGMHLHTLVFRRLVPRLVPVASSSSWVRNATVTCVIAPLVALSTWGAAVLGSGTSTAVAIVALQTLVYVSVYRRLVRGRWRVCPAEERAVRRGLTGLPSMAAAPMFVKSASVTESHSAALPERTAEKLSEAA